ncbi:disease resistance protein Pik-1-like [Zingiber officinale]|uniref:disease resistance protein Pik-1-like n=1 Tax=Zingiber officinale TaxID=94328 RepID=UPI001C4D640C|nr:disease resistance protein Pik-1-like [Zingiber officinale]
MVMRLPTSDAKKRTKALQTASGFPVVKCRSIVVPVGVVSVSWDKDRLIVVGEGIDSVKLIVILRKKIGPVGVELLSVGPYWKDDDAITWSPPPPVSYNYPYQSPAQPYYHPYPYKVRSDEQENCSVM